jgi:cysteine-rich repeat protein
MTRSARFLTGLVSIVAWVSTASGAIDLTGKWRVEYYPTDAELIDVVQSGTAVATEMHGPGGFPGTVSLNGTFTEATGLLSLQVPGCTPPSCFGGVSVQMLPSGDDGNGRLIFGAPPLPGLAPVLMNRCECDDGNTANGDGCDATCRVEPCFSCSGMPSVCTPEPDGAACEDGSPCTTGEQCSAGACGGGSPVAPCVDLSGLWDDHRVDSSFGFASDGIDLIRQRGDTVLFRDPATGAAGFLGVIYPASGVFSLRGVDASIASLFCGSFFTSFNGTASLDNLHFTATGSYFIASPHGCFGSSYTSTGTRRLCGNGTPDPGEACDDGNAVNGDGCDQNCTVTACGNGIVTAGEQCDDGNLADGDGCTSTCQNEICGDHVIQGGEECDDGNLVSGDGCDANCKTTRCGNGLQSFGEECDDGNTTSGDGCSSLCKVEPCYLCLFSQPSNCSSIYQSLCSAPTVPKLASLKITQSPVDSHDALKFATRKGTGVDTSFLGDPRVSTSYLVCLYDSSAPSSSTARGSRLGASATASPAGRRSRTATPSRTPTARSGSSRWSAGRARRRASTRRA